VDGDENERRKRRAAWSSKLFVGPDIHAQIEQDALLEWKAMTPLGRLALTWQLSLEQYGGTDATSMDPRLPRSCYRLERR